jgi:hypothetical protein
VFSTGERAYFVTADGLRLAWQALTMPTSKEMYTSVVDADSGKVLYRHSLTANDNGLAWDYWPGAPNGGVQKPRNLTSPGWLPNDSPRLAGNTVQRRQRRQHRADLGGDHPERASAVQLPVQELQLGRPAVHGDVPVLVGPEDAELVAGQPQPEGGTGLLLPRQVPRPPQPRADRVHPLGR